MQPLMHLQLPQEGPTVSVREGELETGRLVLRAVKSGDGFLVQRAEREVNALERSGARRALRRAVTGLLEGDGDAVRSGLLSYGAVLERHGEHDVAAAVYAAVRGESEDADVALHEARARRKAGERERAGLLYREVRERAGDVRLGLMAAVGEALVAADAMGALGAVTREARARGAWEVVAIAREERARLTSSARDLLAAVCRYRDAADRVRVLHRLADLLAARSDAMGAREALLVALELAPEDRRDHTVQRLRTLARAMGDEVTLRRTRGAAPPALVTLAPARRVQQSGRSLAPRLRRLRAALP